MADSIVSPEQDDGKQDFADRRVFVRHLGDEPLSVRVEAGALVGTWPPYAYRQAFDGPVEVSIGNHTPDVALHEIASRFGAPIASLLRIRNAAPGERAQLA